MDKITNTMREVVANQILAREKVVDAYGHVSIRNPENPERYLMSRSLQPGTGDPWRYHGFHVGRGSNRRRSDTLCGTAYSRRDLRSPAGSETRWFTIIPTPLFRSE